MKPTRYRMSRLVFVALVPLLAGGPASAAEREVIQAGWSGFGQQVSARKLEGRAVRITLAGGDEIDTKLLAVTDTGLVVRDGRATKPWTSGNKKADIPRVQIRSVRFLGRVGHRGLLAGLTGFGSALGIGVALAASQDVFQITEGPVVIAAPAGIVAGAVGVGVACYFIGRATSRPAPEFRIDH